MTITINLPSEAEAKLRAAAETARFHKDFAVLDDLPAVLPIGAQLVVQHQVIGKSAHDARLVAAMIVHRINRLLTFNKEVKRHQGPAGAAYVDSLHEVWSMMLSLQPPQSPTRGR